MRILADSAAISAELERLLKTRAHIDWAVAWASVGFPQFDQLLQSAPRIDRLTIGLHFYQTHPDFLRSFYTHPRVRFAKSVSGTFHPKIYMFRYPSSEWECIIGSANFTTGGLKLNEELCALLTSTDNDADSVRESIDSALSRYWAVGEPMSAEEIEAYRVMWRRNAASLKHLEGKYGQGRVKKNANDGGVSPVESRVLLKPWSQYHAEVHNDLHHTVSGRLDVLARIRIWFHQFVSFGAMPLSIRKRISGISYEKDAETDWQWFGSMKGAGNFKHLIKTNSPSVTAAVDSVPLRGPIGRSNFLEFVELFQLAFDGLSRGGRNPIATATRLLAMKRPDYFVCLDSKNRKGLCQAFEIPQSLTLTDYWDSLAQRIHSAAWWQSDQPKNGEERQIWLGRAAMLDALFYEPMKAK